MAERFLPSEGVHESVVVSIQIGNRGFVLKPLDDDFRVSWPFPTKRIVAAILRTASDILEDRG